MKVVYHSFEGRFSDSPRAIYAALLERFPAADHVWLVDEAHAGTFPADAQAIAYGSSDARAVLETADLLVANTHTDVEWTKSEATLYLQTWHGTPLKRIHWDVLWAPEGRLARLQRDVDRWDALVAPNRASIDPLRGAFRYGRDLVLSGYPRNDVLSRPEGNAVRARLREQLGIEDGVTAVLYAPTWRDDVVFGGGDGDLELEFDAAAIADALGPGYRLLLRLHYMLTGRLAATDHPGVQDVSFHPDISELYLAADVLVTDYSSAMFDFAVTGKPMAFFTFDLAEYRDNLRGFYFDFEPIAPGPLLETNAEVVDALRDLDALSDACSERYAAFRERFCHLEDGHATDRVVDWLTARLRGAPHRVT